MATDGLPDLSVAIVSYNTRDLLRACLQALRQRQAEGEARLEIIVADNGSSDGSIDMVRAEFPEVRLLALGDNLGFGRANNAALENATGRAFCLVNSDAVVQPNTLAQSLAYLDTHAEVGLVGGQLLWPDGRLQTSHGGDPTLRDVFAEQTFLGPVLAKIAAPTPRPSPITPIKPRMGEGSRKKARSQRPSLNSPLPSAGEGPGVGATPRDVDQICGAYMLIRREAWQEVGGFDPAYFMYNEDVDLNVRLRRAGWRVVFLPDVFITHHLGASSSADWRKRANMVSAYNESRFYYFSRFGKPGDGRRLKTYCLLGAGIRLVGWTLLVPIKPGARDKVKLFQEVWRRTMAMKPGDGNEAEL